MTTTPFEVRNRFSGEVQFTAQIACAEDALPSFKLRLAVKWAIKERADLTRANLSRANLSWADLSRADLSGANLTRANLSRADLSGANLTRANLSWADLSGANLTGANLTRANLSGADLSGANLTRANLSRVALSDEQLRAFRADLWLTLSEIGGPLEAQHTLRKLEAGKVDGGTYGLKNGCACLVGTIAEAKGVSANDLSRGAARPAEQWFAMIKPGDLPGANTGGGYAAGVAVRWIKEWCVAHGHSIEPSPVEA